MKEFTQGQKIKAIFWANGEQLISGEGTTQEIEIVMENGQMVGVPWARAIHKDGRIFKHNLALVESVETFE